MLPAVDELFCWQATIDTRRLGNNIAARLNCHYDGVQHGFGYLPDTMQFTDNITGSTTYGNSYEEVRGKLEKMREASVKNVLINGRRKSYELGLG